MPSLKELGRSLCLERLEKMAANPALDERFYFALFSAERHRDCIKLIDSRRVDHDSDYNNDQLRYLIWCLLCLGAHEEIEALANQHRDQIANNNLARHCQLSIEIAEGRLGQVKDASGNPLAFFQLTSFNPSAMQTSLHHMCGMFSEIVELQQLIQIVQGKSVLDIGSLVGNHSVFFGTICDCHVTSVDSDPTCCAYTELNMLINGRSRDTFQVINAYAGNPEEFYTAQGGNDTTTFRLTHDTPRYDFIKIDVDGLELEFLKQSIDYLRHHRPIIFSEISNQNLQKSAELLKPLGYNIEKLTSRSTFENDNNYLLRA